MTTANTQTPLIDSPSRSKTCYSALCAFLFNPRNQCAFFSLVAISLGIGTAEAVNEEKYNLATGLFAGSFVSIGMGISACFFQQAHLTNRITRLEQAVENAEEAMQTDTNAGVLKI